MLIEGYLVGAAAPAPEPLAVPCLIDDDPIDPGFKGRLAAEAADGAEDPQEDFLGQVQSLVAVAQEMKREGVDHPLVAGYELRAGHFFSGDAALYQRCLSAGEFRPSECACVFHQFLGCESWTHG